MHCKIWKVGFTLKDMHTDCVKIWLQPSRSEARVSYSWSKTPLNFVYALQCNLHVMQASSLCRLAIHEDSNAPEFVNLSENLRESVRKGRVCGLMGPLLLLSHLLFLCLCLPSSVHLLPLQSPSTWGHRSGSAGTVWSDLAYLQLLRLYNKLVFNLICSQWRGP